MARRFVCIVCPSSCWLDVEVKDGKIAVSGNECARGASYGLSEYINPVRMLTATVAVTGGARPRLPVAGAKEIPKDRLEECLREVYKAKVEAPVEFGQVILENVCGTGVDICAQRSMRKAQAG